MGTRARKLNEGLVSTYGGMINDIEQNLARGGMVDDCLAKTMLNLKAEEKLDDMDMAILASAFMIGGVETVGRQSSSIWQTKNILTQDRLLQSCSGFPL